MSFEVTCKERKVQEDNPHRLEQRLKQLSLGYNTEGYRNYSIEIPKKKRILGEHPSTPRITQKCSKRSWDGQVRIWRRSLHKWDFYQNEYMRLLLKNIGKIEEETCTICYESKDETRCIHCGHTISCGSQCVKSREEEMEESCFICKSPFNKRIRIYLMFT